jgi:hypothetical protein
MVTQETAMFNRSARDNILYGRPDATEAEARAAHGDRVTVLRAEFGGNDSNEELRFLQGIVGGDQTLEPESIDALLKSAQAKIDRGIKRTQAQQKAVLEGQPLPTGSATLPRATKRFNPQTGRIETIKD